MDIWDLQAFGKHMFPSETYLGFSWHVWQFRLALFQNHHRNKIRTRGFDNMKVGYDLLKQATYHLRSYTNVMQFPISPRRKSRYRDTSVVKIWVLREFSANSFVLSEAEHNTSNQINAGGLVDLLLLKTILSICQK